MTALHRLTNTNLDDLVNSFGWQNSPILALALRKLFRAPAQKFARQMLHFDAEIPQQGLPAAAQNLFKQFSQTLHILGLENIPSNGPALFLSNHPGMVDTLALFIAIQRADLRILAIERPFLQALTHTSEQLIFVSNDPTRRLSAVKTAAAHLKNGGAALTFPAGKIEPDPQTYPGAQSALSHWSDSAGVLTRLAPQTQIIPTLVSGVLWEKAVKHPLTQLKKTSDERERVGAALQLLAHILFETRPLTITVQFAPPICAATIEKKSLHRQILAAMQGLIEEQANERFTTEPTSSDNPAH